MTLPSSPSVAPKLDDIIDGVMDADIPDERKAEVLRMMESEGGVTSDKLCSLLIEIFEEEARVAKAEAAEEDELRSRIESQIRAQDPDAALEDAQIVYSITSEQDQIVKEHEEKLLAVRGDIERMEREAGNSQEKQRREQVDEVLMKKFRDTLSSPGDASEITDTTLAA